MGPESPKGAQRCPREPESDVSSFGSGSPNQRRSPHWKEEGFGFHNFFRRARSLSRSSAGRAWRTACGKWRACGVEGAWEGAELEVGGAWRSSVLFSPPISQRGQERSSQKAFISVAPGLSRQVVEAGRDGGLPAEGGGPAGGRGRAPRVLSDPSGQMSGISGPSPPAKGPSFSGEVSEGGSR